MKIKGILLSVAVAFSLGNAINLDEKSQTIENIKTQISMLEKLENTNIYVEIKTEILDILEGKIKVEDEAYNGQYLSQLQKDISESLTSGFYQSISEKNYQRFGKLLELYKIELVEQKSINPNDFLDLLFEEKNIEFFKIIKDKQIDKFNVFDGAEETFLGYLQKNKVDKNIVKMFE